MDPLGFALENYDGVGKWRTKDAGSTIDASGKLPDGTQFEGPAGLKKILLTQHRDEFVDHRRREAADLCAGPRPGVLR